MTIKGFMEKYEITDAFMVASLSLALRELLDTENKESLLIQFDIDEKQIEQMILDLDVMSWDYSESNGERNNLKGDK